MRLRSAALPLVAVLAGFALGACSGLPSINIESKRIDYKSAGKLPPLEVPPDLTRPGTDDRFNVPDVNPRATATYSDYTKGATGRATTGGTTVLPRQENLRIERDGNQRWLVVRGAPQQVWPLVKDFWQEAGFIINVEVPEAGVMETDWAENRAKIDQGAIRGFLGRLLDTVYTTGERDKFRTRLEIGAEPGTTEIYISHRGMEEVYTTSNVDSKDTYWQPRKPDPNLESMMLGRLMARFGADDGRVKSQLAGGVTVQPRATLSRGADGGMLSLDDQFDRAWRRVGLALDRVGFTVEDRDRSKGLYFVRYIDPRLDAKVEDKSWLSRLRFWGSSEKPKMEQYRIEVKDVAKGSQVKVLSKDGKVENPETAGRILALLYEQLR